MILRPPRASRSSATPLSLLQRRWIPVSAINRIRDVCATISGPEPCLDVDIDPATVEALEKRFSTDSALLAYRLREQGLNEKRGRTRQAIDAVEEAIELLE